MEQLFFIGGPSSIAYKIIEENAEDPLDRINYLENHMTNYPRLGVV
jgi:hypothetical protein